MSASTSQRLRSSSGAMAAICVRSALSLSCMSVILATPCWYFMRAVDTVSRRCGTMSLRRAVEDGTDSSRLLTLSVRAIALMYVDRKYHCTSGMHVGYIGVQLRRGALTAAG